MKLTKFVLFMVVLGLLATAVQFNPASAASRDGSEGCGPEVDLVVFVAEETGYPPLRNCPRVMVTKDMVLRSFVAKVALHGEEPLAAFLPASGEILLSRDVDLSTILGRSYMVHEIVHAFQFENRVMAPSSCLGLLESEAYQVQANYLRKNNLIEDATAFELISMMQSSCAHPYHR